MNNKQTIDDKIILAIEDIEDEINANIFEMGILPKVSKEKIKRIIKNIFQKTTCPKCHKETELSQEEMDDLTECDSCEHIRGDGE